MITDVLQAIETVDTAIGVSLGCVCRAISGDRWATAVPVSVWEGNIMKPALRRRHVFVR